jgi:hypothetical protein
MSYEQQAVNDAYGFLYKPTQDTTPQVVEQPRTGIQVGSALSNGQEYAIMRDQNGEFVMPVNALSETTKTVPAEVHIRKEGDHYTVAATGGREDIRSLLANPLGMPISGHNIESSKETRQNRRPDNKNLLPALHMPGRRVRGALAALAIVSVTASVSYGASSSLTGNRGTFMDFSDPMHLMSDPIHNLQDIKKIGKLIGMVS